MLINKYQHQQEKEQHRQDERARREEKHWGCPFFTDCWNAGLRVPSVDDCPECNKIHGNQFSYKRQCSDGRSLQPIYRDELQRGFSQLLLSCYSFLLFSFSFIHMSLPLVVLLSPFFRSPFPFVIFSLFSLAWSSFFLFLISL